MNEIVWIRRENILADSLTKFESGKGLLHCRRHDFLQFEVEEISVRETSVNNNEVSWKPLEVWFMMTSQEFIGARPFIRKGDDKFIDENKWTECGK